MSNSALAEELLKINSETLGASGKEEYDTLTGKIYPRVCESLYVTSQKNYQVANYDTAVTNLEASRTDGRRISGWCGYASSCTVL